MLIKKLDTKNLDQIRQYNLDVVTLDGETRSNKGVMVGGYYSDKVRIHFIVLWMIQKMLKSRIPYFLTGALLQRALFSSVKIKHFILFA